MHARFYAPDARASGDVVALPEDEAQHLLRVLRLKRGEAVRVFNGRGGEFSGRVESVGRDEAHIRLGDAALPARESRIAVTLAHAVLKGDKMDGVIRDAVMMGATAIQPLVTARAEVPLDVLRRGRRRERWHKIAVSSAKQCGRAVVPPILEPFAFDELARALGDRRLPAPAVLLAEPGAPVHAVGLGELDAMPPPAVTVVVGPEGGWTPEELAAAAGSCRPVTLGARTLRADAVAIVAMAALFARWHEF